MADILILVSLTSFLSSKIKRILNEASEANLNADKRILKCTPFLHRVYSIMKIHGFVLFTLQLNRSGIMNLETMEIVIGAGKYFHIFCPYILSGGNILCVEGLFSQMLHAHCEHLQGFTGVSQPTQDRSCHSPFYEPFKP